LLKNYNKSILKSELGIREEIVIYARTTNEIQAVKFLLKSFARVKFMSYRKHVGSHLESIGVFENIHKKPNLAKFGFLLYLFINPRYGVRYHNKISAAYEIYEEYLSIFSKERPSIIIISNDHSTDC